jgi:hypothetical protein
MMPHLSLWVTVPGAIAAVVLAVFLVVVAGEAYCAAKTQRRSR